MNVASCWRMALCGAVLSVSPALAQATDPWVTCSEAAAVAERAAGVPEGLLLAIGRVESGRSDGSGRVVPWPNSVNVEGAGRYFPDAAGAIEHVRAALSRGARSIDVGCFQVNLQHHPQAFASLADGFDPARNAEYAAQLLARHYARSGSWDVAVGFYHSMTVEFGGPYAARVLAGWKGGNVVAVAGGSAVPTGRSYLPVVWRPGTPSGGSGEARGFRLPVFVPLLTNNSSRR